MKQAQKHALVKIDFLVYKQVSELVKSENSGFPSIKNFVESAIKKQIEMGGYNATQKLTAIPNETARKTEKNLLPCLVCGRVFFCTREEVEKRKIICPNCRRAILYFADKMKK